MSQLFSFRIVFLFYCLIFTSSLLFSQDTIPTRVIPDSTTIDTTVIDTIVIRKPQNKVKLVPRGAHLTNPYISFKRTKPLKDKYKRFKIPSFWTKENTLGIDVSEVAFVNWNAGGDNAISGLGFLKFIRNYKFRYIQWDNNIELRYGLNAQEGRKTRKSEDVIRMSSNLGYRRDTISNWYYSVQLNFNTQFSNGYKYPNRDEYISTFMAPGYLFFGAGTSFITQDQRFNIYISPLTLKSTFVLDQTLADKGSFGVKKAVLDANGNVITPGDNYLTELGFLVTNNFKWDVTKNIELKSRLNLYTDYLASFGNIDIDWELNLKLRVNKYILTTLGTHIIYDDDILFDAVKNADGIVIDPGERRIQFKQLIAVGISFDF